MYKHIKDIIEQCKETSTSYFDGRGNVTETYFDREKFAELIVRECADVAHRTGKLNASEFVGGMIADAIKERFGVNE